VNCRSLCEGIKSNNNLNNNIFKYLIYIIILGAEMGNKISCKNGEALKSTLKPLEAVQDFVRNS